MALHHRPEDLNHPVAAEGKRVRDGVFSKRELNEAAAARKRDLTKITLLRRRQFQSRFCSKPDTLPR